MKPRGTFLPFKLVQSHGARWPFISKVSNWLYFSYFLEFKDNMSTEIKYRNTNNCLKDNSRFRVTVPNGRCTLPINDLAAAAASFPGGTRDKEPACQCRRQKTQVWSLGWEDPLEEETATHSSILVWEIPWTEEPGRLQSMGSQIVGHDCTHVHIDPRSALLCLKTEWWPPSFVLQHGSSFSAELKCLGVGQELWLLTCHTS